MTYQRANWTHLERLAALPEIPPGPLRSPEVVQLALAQNLVPGWQPLLTAAGYPWEDRGGLVFEGRRGTWSVYRDLDQGGHVWVWTGPIEVTWPQRAEA